MPTSVVPTELTASGPDNTLFCGSAQVAALDEKQLRVIGRGSAPGAVEGGRAGWPEYEGVPFIAGLLRLRKEDSLLGSGLTDWAQ
jgi:hypothetical protein